MGVVLFDNALMLLRERMGSKKLFLKERKVAEEAFASGRDTFVSLLTSYSKKKTFAMVAFHSMDIVEKSFSEPQIWLE